MLSGAGATVWRLTAADGGGLVESHRQGDSAARAHGGGGLEWTVAQQEEGKKAKGKAKSAEWGGCA